jgi:Protein of unknown function (DUF1353)
MTHRALPVIRLSLVIASCCSWMLSAQVSGADDWGKFSTDPVIQLLADGRLAKVVDFFSYTDPRGRVWPVPASSIVNGASIPRVVWSLTGGPWDGKYRNASIVHDIACDEKKHSWKDVHRMYYEACRAGGLGVIEAKAQYWAVYHFGPRWKDATKNFQALTEADRSYNRPLMTVTEYEQKLKDISAKDPSLEELEGESPFTPTITPPASR